MAGWLVTGAQGFLGRYVVVRIQAAEPQAQIVGVGRSPELNGVFPHTVTTPNGPVPAPFADDLPAPGGGYGYRQLNLIETKRLQTLLNETKPKYIIHLASGLRGDHLPRLLESTLLSTGSLFRAIRAANLLPTVILASTGGVYGRLADSDLPVRESHCPQPADEYSVAKLAAEHLARNAARSAGVRLVICRIFNLLGPAQDERHVSAQIALQLARVERGAAAEIKLGSLEATRDFVDVRDAADALVHLAKAPESPVLVNIATGRECSIAHLLQTFLKRAKLEVAVQSNRGVLPDVLRHVGDVKRLAGVGWKPCYPLESSIDSIWSYYQRLWGT